MLSSACSLGCAQKLSDKVWDLFQIPIVTDALWDPGPSFSHPKGVVYIPAYEVFCSGTAEAVSTKHNISQYSHEKRQKDLNLGILTKYSN